MAKFAANDLACLRGQNLIFTNLAFEMAAGGALILAGPNGSGKSSLIRILAGLIKPFSGNLLWDEKDIFTDIEDHFDRLIYIGHENAIKVALTIGENLKFWASLYETYEKVDVALNAFGLAGISENLGGVLSSGQRRRLNLARLLISARALWILDEPTAGLDTAACKGLETLISTHRKAGGMVILSTHVGIDVPDHQILDMSLYSKTIPASEAN